jgi:hypothetical protein
MKISGGNSDNNTNKKLDCKCTVIDDDDADKNNDNKNDDNKNDEVDEIENFDIEGENSDPASFYRNGTKKTHPVNSENDVHYASNFSIYDSFGQISDIGRNLLENNNNNDINHVPNTVLSSGSVFDNSPAYID